MGDRITGVFDGRHALRQAGGATGYRTMPDLMDRILAISPDVRYVAVYRDGQLVSRQRQGLSAPSSTDSDRYEELLVNPTILTLVQQRGAIDCGGAHYVIVRYGNFFQLIVPVRGGHVSIALETHADPVELARQVAAVLADAGLEAGTS